MQTAPLTIHEDSVYWQILQTVRADNADGHLPTQGQAVELEWYSSKGAGYRRRKCNELEDYGLIEHVGREGRVVRRRYRITAAGMLALGYPAEQAHARLAHYAGKIRRDLGEAS